MADRNTTIRASQLRNFSVTAEDLKNNSITGDKFIDLTVSGSKIANSTITDGKLASLYIYANGTRSFTNTVSGVAPILNAHLATKSYVDTQVSGVDTLEIDPTPNITATVKGMTATMTVDVNTTGFGAALYMASDGNFEEANATSSGTMPCTVLAAEAGTGEKLVLLVGFARNDTWTWTPGEMIYVDTTNGGLTQTQPLSSEEFIQLIGYATHTDRMYFNPNLAMSEVA